MKNNFRINLSVKRHNNTNDIFVNNGDVAKEDEAGLLDILNDLKYIPSHNFSAQKRKEENLRI